MNCFQCFLHELRLLSILCSIIVGCCFFFFLTQKCGRIKVKILFFHLPYNARRAFRSGGLKLLILCTYGKVFICKMLEVALPRKARNDLWPSYKRAASQKCGALIELYYTHIFVCVAGGCEIKFIDVKFWK